MNPTVESPAPVDGLVLTDVRLRYGAVVALRGVDIRVRRGSIAALLGANGAGKTSLLRAISGNTTPHGARVTGSIRWAGKELAGRAPADTVRAGVAQVPEGRRIFARMTVHENLLTGRQRAHHGDAADIETIYTLFPVLAERRIRPAGFLSGGEQQMLAIGRALMTGPDLLMLDEPSLGLAPKMVGRIMDVIRDINSRGTTVLLIEQNATMALELASHATVLELGTVALSGAATDDGLMDSIRALYLTGTDTSGALAPTTVRPPLPVWRTDDEQDRR
ncbi:ABC transporter ATP-binding protein [Microbacterium sp. 22303]|uniref:ABC transporter ATP-binding protein n=1 Tax=Microbacterium sp. 22303 TaxID=3453905 RepID=UPI003F86B115